MPLSHRSSKALEAESNDKKHSTNIRSHLHTRLHSTLDHLTVTIYGYNCQDNPLPPPLTRCLTMPIVRRGIYIYVCLVANDKESWKAVSPPWSTYRKLWIRWKRKLWTRKTVWSWAAADTNISAATKFVVASLRRRWRNPGFIILLKGNVCAAC